MMPDGEEAHHQFRVAAFVKPWQRQAVYASPEDTGFVHIGTVEARATIGELLQPLQPGPRGRIVRADGLTLRLHGGELASVSRTRLLNGANAAAVMSNHGAWEVLQFGTAEETAPNIWSLRDLLRGQLGTSDAMIAGAAAGAPFVLLDSAVTRAGLLPHQAGLPLNFRVGPAGRDPGSSSYVHFGQAGGIRAKLPLAPVHLRMGMGPNGDAKISWIRCGRIDADNWFAEDIPLGEETERYRVEIASLAGEVRRVAETSSPHFAYFADANAADFPERPMQLRVNVRQLSASVGAGIAASRTFTLP